MKNKEEVRIELTATSALDLMSLGTKDMVDLEHPPYKEFMVSFPSEKIDVEEFEKMMSEVGEDKMSYMSKLSKKEKMELIKDYNNNAVEIMAKVEPNRLVVGTREWHFTLNTSNPVFSLEKEVAGVDIELDFSTINKSIEDDYNNSEVFRKGLMHYLFGVIGLISFMQSDKMNVIEPTTRLQLDDSKKKKKSKNKNKKTYIYKKKYVIDDTATKGAEEVTSREYNRKVDQWIRRGHWRESKNGKRTWIEQKVCKARATVDKTVSQEYKITKIK